jgi:hypothetical protein
MLRRMLALRGTKGQKELHNEELHNSYSTMNIIRTTKPKSKRWMDHVAGREKGTANNILV